MASYSYAGLSVRVTADTRDLARQVQADSLRAGNASGQAIGRQLTRSISGAAQTIGSTLGRAVTSGVSRAGAAVTTVFGRAFSAVQGVAGRAAAAAGSAFTRALGPAGAAVTNSLGRAFAAVQGAAGRAAAAAGSVFSRAVAPAGTAITTSLGRAFSAVSTAGGRAASAVGTAFTRAANGAATAVGMLGQTMAQSFRTAQAQRGGGGVGGLEGMLAAAKRLPVPILAAGAAAAALGKSVIGTGISYNTLSQTSRAAFKTILGSSKAADQMMQNLSAFAKTSPFPRQAFIEGARQMVGFGIESKKVIPYFTAIQDAVAATGGGAQDLSDITLVMSQIQAAGKITGVDLMQFAQRGIDASTLIGSAMGKTGKQIKDEISSGSFDATKALDALVAGMNKRFGGAAANVKTTWAGTSDSIKGAMRDVGGALVAPFIDPKGGGYAVTWGNKLATSLRAAIPYVTMMMRGLSTVIGWLVVGLGKAVDFISRFSGWLGPLAGGIAAAVLVIKAYQFAMWAATVAQGVWTAAVNATKFAMFALKYSIMTNPIGVLVIALIVLVTAFVLAWRNSETFRNIVMGVLHAVANAFIAAWNWVRTTTLVVFNAVKNAVLGALNWVKNAFATVWNWIRTHWPLLLAIITGPIGLAVYFVIRNWQNLKNWTLAVFAAVRNAIAAALATVRNVVSVTVGYITGAWGRLRNATLAVGIWLQNFLGGLWGRIRNGAANAWNGIVNTIGNVFGRLKSVVMAPVRWVVNHVINRVISGFNVLITKVGIPRIALVTGFRTGGRIPGGWGGGDKQMIAAEPGEWVLTKEQSRAIGYDNLRQLPRYQHGGLVGDEHMPGGIAPRFPSLKDIGGAFVRVTGLDNLARAARDLFDPVTRLLTFAASQAFGVLTAPLKKMVAPWTTDRRVMPYQWLGKLTTTMIDKAVSFIAGKSMDACGSLGAGNVGGIVGRALKFNGHAYRWAGGANPSTGFDCSSFVSYIAGISGLPLPGGFRVPSGAHGPVTTDYLRWGGMRSKPLNRTKPGDVAVSPTHIGFIIGPGGSGFAARSTETGIGPQNFAGGGYTYREWLANKGSAPGTTTGICAPGVGGGLGIPGNIESWRGLVTQMANRLGIPETVNAWLTQIRTESGGNPNAIQQVHDVNWPHNRAQGLLQVIPTTFAAYAGPYRNLGPLNPAANIFAAMAYAISRYGRRNILSVIGHGHGYAGGGLIGEPVIGFGVHSAQPYSFGERGPEWISPLSGPGAQVGSGARRIQINVYPSPGMDERELAVRVGRELQWAIEAGAL